MSSTCPNFVLPRPTRATRLPALRSKGSSRGAIVGGNPSRIYVYESSLERKLLALLLTSTSVIDIWDQPPAVFFMKENGRRCRHIFDFLVTMSCGEKVAVAVKPEKRVARRGFDRTMKHVAQQLDRRFADRVVIVTEEYLDPALVHDAELALFYSREEDLEADQAIDVVTAGLVGKMTVNDVVTLTGFGGRAFRALVRLVAKGKVRRTSFGPLGMTSMIERVA